MGRKDKSKKSPSPPKDHQNSAMRKDAYDSIIRQLEKRNEELRKENYHSMMKYLEKRNADGTFAKGNVSCPEARTYAAKNNPGNQYNRKMTTPELRQEVFREYCEWLACGRSRESFTFNNGSVTISFKTIENYIAQFPEEFNAELISESKRKGQQVWEDVGVEMMIGEIKKCQPAIYQMMMRNKFGWDKYENKKEDNLETDVRSLLKRLEEMKMHEVIAIPLVDEEGSDVQPENEVSNAEDFEEIGPFPSM